MGERTLGAWIAAGIALIGLLGAYVLHGAMPPTAVHFPLEKVVQTQHWAPQGWAFFTRSPRTAQPRPFARAGDGWVDAGIGPGSSPRNVFGLNRAVHAQGAEVGLLAKDLPASSWHECRTRSEWCMERYEGPPVEVRNSVPSKTLCGDIAIARAEPLPWAWAVGRRPPVPPSNVVVLRVSC